MSYNVYEDEEFSVWYSAPQLPTIRAVCFKKDQTCFACDNIIPAGNYARENKACRYTFYCESCDSRHARLSIIRQHSLNAIELFKKEKRKRKLKQLKEEDEVCVENVDIHLASKKNLTSTKRLNGKITDFVKKIKCLNYIL